jgi:hypothetical protein
MWIAAIPIRRLNDFAGTGTLRHTRYNELLRADDNIAIHISKAHLGPSQLFGPKTFTADADLASDQSAAGIDPLDMGNAVYVPCARLAVHDLQLSH